jgi:hypothetical protein
MRRLKLTLIAGLLLIAAALLARLPAAAQGDDACPVFVEQALALADESCAGLGRNEVCYGHSQVEALDWQDDPLADFEAPGAVTDVSTLAALTTSPLMVADDEWGVAVMSLQADLPDSLPGQAVTFVVFGDVSLRSEVVPGEAAPVAEPVCLARASAGVNLRAGPGTADAVVGGMAAGDALPIIGRTDAGDWLQVAVDGDTAWVAASVVIEDCGDAADIAYTAPMQAFFLETGFGDPACAEAPRDGLLVQAPQQTTVHFRVNGVEVAVGSTAYLTAAPGDRLSVATFDGAVTVTSGGESIEVEPGFQVLAAADTPPEDPQPYAIEQVEAAPVDLLPDPVTVPIPAAAAPASGQPTSTPAGASTDETTGAIPSDAGPTGSGGGGTSLPPEQVLATVTVSGTSDCVDSGFAVTAGQIYLLAASGGVNPCAGFDHEWCGYHGPDGIPGVTGADDAESNPPLLSAPLAGLLGRIGSGAPFFVGSGGKSAARHAH